METHRSDRFLLILLLSTLLLGCTQQNPQSTNSPTDKELALEFKEALFDKLLFVWYPRIVDEENGGYYTNFSFDWKLMPEQNKMIVSQARDLWTACKAAERFPDYPRYKNAADHGFRFLRDFMWDKKNGGFNWEVSQTGEKRNDSPQYKKSYGIAFAIYGLAAYHKLNGSDEALELAQKGFLWLEDNVHDTKYGGYWDWITEDCISYASDNYERHLFPAEAKNVEWKDYNSSIHLMEAFAELLSVWPDTLLRTRLEEMLEIVRDIMTTKKGYLQMYFKSDWSVISYRDSARKVLDENIHYDHVTPGHDIETAYLLLEAAHVLGEKQNSKTLEVAKKLIDHTIQTGFDADYAGLVEIGYYFRPDGKMEILRDTKTWWAQVEGLNALLLFARLYPGEPIYKEAFLKLWDYVKANFIDHEHGGWYSQGLDKRLETKSSNKAQPWKSCYHTSRGLMNCLEMLECLCPPFKFEH
jgi:cellobiose epimerase